MIDPPRWTESQLQDAAKTAIKNFRAARSGESLNLYVQFFDEFAKTTQSLLKKLEGHRKGTLTDHDVAALLSQKDLLKAFRFLSSPPISADDLSILAEASLAPQRLRADPEMAKRVFETVIEGLDPRRFGWLEQDRTATSREINAAVVATAAMMATQRVATMRRMREKDVQEQGVVQLLSGLGFERVSRREIKLAADWPASGTFCKETILGSAKADFVVGLWDKRIMAMECKVSNSATNSVKRLNREAVGKASSWLQDFGRQNVVPAAVLSGVFKVRNLVQAQEAGLTVFWAHDLDRLAEWIGSTQQ